MQLSTLITETRRMLGGITSADYSDADITTSLNRHMHDMTVLAILANGVWEVQGEISTANLVASQKEYQFPSNIISLKRIEVNLTGNADDWDTCKINDLRTLPTLSNSDVYGMDVPIVDLYDDSMFFVNAPDTSVTNGLKIYWSKENTELSGSTDEPNFPEFLHIGLVYGACFDFALGKKLNQETQNFKSLIVENEKRLKEYYAGRLPAKRTRITPRYDSYE